MLQDWSTYATTRLLNSRVGRRLPARQWLILLAVVAWVALGAVVGGIAQRAREQAAPLEPRTVYLIITASPAPTQPPTLTATPAPPSATPAPATPVVIVEYVPIEVEAAPQVIAVDPPCDVAVNPRYSARIDVLNHDAQIGVVTGASCVSQDDAQQRAQDLAATMRTIDDRLRHAPEAAPSALPRAQQEIR